MRSLFIADNAPSPQTRTRLARSSRWWSALAALIVCLSAPATGWCAPPAAEGEAAPVAPEPEGYRVAIDTALQELRLGNFLEAREQFARAHALAPSARTLRGLGIAEFELKHYVAAIDYLNQSLTSNVKPLDERIRAEVETLSARARSYVGTIALTISPASATVRVDGVKEVSDLRAPLSLELGDHTLEFQAQGYVSERRQVSVRGGQLTQLKVDLVSLTAPNVARTDQGDVKPLYKRWWLWTIVGVAAAGIATGAALAARGPHTEVEAPYSTNGELPLKGP